MQNSTVTSSKIQGFENNKNEFSDISQMKKAIEQSKQPGYFFHSPLSS